MRPKLAYIISHALTAFVVLAVGIALSAAAAYFMARQMEHDTSLKFERVVAEAEEAIETRIRAYSDVLLGVRALFIASDSVTRDEFKTYIASLDLNRRYPGIQVIHFAQRVPAAQRQAFEAMVRNDRSVDPRGYPDFSAKPPGDRIEYFIVQYVEPMSGNEAALGLDLGSDAVRLAALERTRDSSHLTASGTIALALDPKRHPGFAMRLPVYRKGMPVATVAQRREAFTGIVSTSFVVIDLMRGVLSAQFMQTMHVRIHDAGFLDSSSGLQQPSAKNLMFDNDRLLPAGSRRDISSGSKLANLTRIAELEVGGRRWNLHFSAREGFIAPSERLLPWGAFLVGTLISLMLFGMIRSLATSGRRAIYLAERITQDLRKSEAGLAEAQRMTQQLIEALPNPIFFKGTDGRYLGVNRAWEKFFGVPRETFVGKTVHDLYPDNPEVAGRLHAMDQVLWDRPGSQVYETVITTPDRQRHDAIYYKATFTHADGSIAGLIGTIIDITERKEIERRFELTFNYAAIGILHTSLDQRMLLANKRFLDMTGYSLEELRDKPTAMIIVPDDVNTDAELEQQLLEGKIDTYQSEKRYVSKHGKVISTKRTTSVARGVDGTPQYYIRVIEDVSETKLNEERYRAMFENAAVGITRVDLHGVLVDANQKFCDMVGYSRVELLGKPIRDITHPDDYGQGATLRGQVTEGTIPSAIGEKRFVRKDGAIIWVRRTMSIARDDGGKPQYVISVVEDITESKRIEEDRARLAAIVEFSQDAILSRDSDGRVLSWNTAAERLFGFTAAEVIGQNISELIIPPERHQETHRTRRLLEQGQILRDFRTERRTKDGRRVPVSLSQSPIRDVAGTVIGVGSIVRDITEQEHTEKCQAMEHAVTKVLAESVTVDEAMPKLIRIMCEAMEWAYGARWAWNEEEQRLCRAEYWCEFEPEFDPADREHWLKAADSGTGRMLSRVWRNKESTWLANLHDDKPFRRRPSAAKFGWHSAYAFPILAGSAAIGVMEFFGREVRRPDEMLVQITTSIGSQIGQFLARTQAEERVRHLAHYDGLTGLPNRTMFNERLRHALTHARRTERSLAILFIDLDRFKNINDTLGHDAGDRVLNEVAQRLRGCLRDSDTVGRLGGDEFVVLIEEPPQPVNAAVVARKILNATGEPFLVQAQEFHITASIGISTYPADGAEMQTLMKNADIAMYRAKEKGKDNFQFYSAQTNVHSIERLTLESNLRRALERNEFLLHYQPKMELASGRITGVEALLRWQQPLQGLIPPAQFIQLAEETGLIVPIGEWVLKTACAQNKAWQQQGWAPVRIAVNLSPRQFAYENLLEDIARALKQTGLDPAFLELEITESVVMRNPEQAVILLNRLRAFGIHLAIDDFGTGYSSLNYLKRFPLDSLKIDRTFIQDLPGDADDAAITQAIIAMAHSLRLKVVAEGVETAEQLNFLRDYKCDEIQGYYFSKPRPERDIAPLLRDNAEAGKVHSLR